MTARGLVLIVFVLAMANTLRVCHRVVTKDGEHGGSVSLEEREAGRCEQLASRSALSDSERARARRSAKLWRNGVQDQAPRLLVPRLLPPSSFWYGGTYWILYLAFCDEQGDVRKVGIEEVLADGSKDVHELYEVFAGSNAGFDTLAILIPVCPRAAGERKDNRAWRKYVRRGEADPMKQPPMYISLPASGRRVRIWVVDAEGNSSEHIELVVEERADGGQGVGEKK